MATRQINPTRMELTKLKNQLQMTSRGHKLLKDKQDEMIRRFMLIIEEAKVLRTSVDSGLSLTMQQYKAASARSNPHVLYEAMMLPSNEVKLKFSKKNIMSVHVPTIKLENSGTKSLTYSLSSTPASLDKAILKLEELLPDLIKLAEIDKQIKMLAREIEKTRRRVNAIEHIMIPKLEANIKKIMMKLDDNERSTTVRMMKSKEIVTQKSQKQNESN
jgi:V/A-type H+-transporting ATPase subunit D